MFNGSPAIGTNLSARAALDVVPKDSALDLYLLALPGILADPPEFFDTTPRNKNLRKMVSPTNKPSLARKKPSPIFWWCRVKLPLPHGVVRKTSALHQNHYWLQGLAVLEFHIGLLHPLPIRATEEKKRRSRSYLENSSLVMLIYELGPLIVNLELSAFFVVSFLVSFNFLFQLMLRLFLMCGVWLVLVFQLSFRSFFPCLPIDKLDTSCVCF